MNIEIVGNYRIGFDPWRLIEIRVTNPNEDFDFSGLILPVDGLPKENWQVPWDERILEKSEDDAGQTILSACFFLFVESGAKLQTPVGEISLLPISDKPSRLGFVQFEKP